MTPQEYYAVLYAIMGGIAVGLGASCFVAWRLIVALAWPATRYGSATKDRL
jgi:hypothetical protein